MTRIIAGSAKGRKLEVPKKGTRPTSDRVREALFSMAESAVSLRGAAVLDLYAGSGALALEAMSRGAESAVLVEASRAAATTAKRNVSHLGFAGSARVVVASVEQFLQSKSGPFNIVFLDPPYSLSNADLEGVLARVVGVLEDPGLVVVERPSKEGQPLLPAGLEVLKTRKWGTTSAWFLTTAAEGEEE